MDQAERDHIQHELEITANELFPGWIRRVELLQHDDAPMIEPGQVMPRLVLAGLVERPDGGQHRPVRRRRPRGRRWRVHPRGGPAQDA
jgi:hypothetical protein